MASSDQKAEALPVAHNVLVVDDYEPWRHYVCSELRKHARWRVVGEGADGLEAVRMAQALEPDLILLDVNLPAINGLEAARRIIGRRTGSRILFLSEQHSSDIAEAALETGARGYLLKVDAGRDLLFAMEAVINRGRFVSGVLLERGSRQNHGHEAGFHCEEESLLDDYTRFAGAALASD